MKRYFFILALSIWTLHSFAQNTFIKIFSDVDATKEFSGRHIVRTIDGNYSFLCTNNTFPVIIRVNENGNEFNRFTIQRYRLNPVCLAADNQFNYFFVGRDSAIFTGYKAKADSTGNLFFHQGEYGAVGGSQAHGVYRTPDNGMLYSFWNNSEMCYDPEYFFKADSLNVYEWSRDISSNMSNASKQSFQFLSADEICAVGPHLTGCYDTIQYYSSDLRVFDTTGAYVNYNFSELYHTIDTTFGGGFILGSSNQFAKMDTGTGIVWTNPMPAGMSFQIALRQLTDSSFLLAGDQFVTNFGQQIMINKYDWSGNLIWSKHFGESGDEFFSNMLLTDDNGFLISGTTTSYGSLSKAFILKADSLGNSVSMPLITSSTDRICSGDSTALTLPAGYTYLWNTGDTSQTIYATQANSYWAVLSSGGNQYYTDTLSLNVVSTIKPDLGNDTILCAGTEFILDAGLNYTAYRWSTGSFLHSDTITIGGNYIVEAIDSNSCSMFDTVQVGFISLPPFDLGPDIFQCDTLPVVLQSPGILQWYWNDLSTDTTLTVTSSGIYSIIYTNGVCTDSDFVTVAMNIPLQVNLPDDTTLCINQNLILNAGAGFVDYEWQDGANTQTYIASSSIVATIQYSVMTIDSNGCSSTDDIVIDFQICPSTNDLQFAEDFKIFPNPVISSGILRIESENKRKLTIEILSVTGIAFYRKEVETVPENIFIGDISPGIYFLRITENESGKYFNSKLIVN